jgi:site-specific recombinase XerD
MSEIIPFDPSKRLPSVELSDRAREYIKHSARPNTRRAYAAQLKQWLAWCEARGSQPFPADPASVANYLAERAGAGQSVSTLRTVVAAIKAGHSAQGLAFDTQAPEIAKTLRGVSNASPKLPRQAEPIRGADILELMSTTDATPAGQRDAALLALGYVFALRRSELVALDLETLGTGQGVLRITAKTMEIAFAISKTGTGEPQVVAVPRAENAEAVKAVEAWIETASIQRGEPILRHVIKGGAIGGRLHLQSVAKIIKARVGEHYRRHGAPEAKATIEAARFSGHSLRVGFSVSAAEGGADIRAIASVTRHRSLAMPARYAQKAEQIRTSPLGCRALVSTGANGTEHIGGRTWQADFWCSWRSS